MSVIKISELTNVETPILSDVLPIVNENETKNITLEQIVNTVETSMDLGDYAKKTDVETMINTAINGALEGEY